MAVEEIFIVNQAEKFKKLEELLSENRDRYLWLSVYLGTHIWYVLEERKYSPPCPFWPAVLQGKIVLLSLNFEF